MDDFLEYTAVRRHQGLYGVMYYMTQLIAVLFGVYALIALSGCIGINPQTGRMNFSLQSLLLALAAGAVAFAAFRGKDSFRIEYDYSFTNGALDVSSVMNNMRRRYLCALEMKDVIRCGPASGPAFAKSLSEPNVKRHNWFVNREAKLYFIYFQKKGIKHVAVMELPDEMISVMRSRKYLKPGVWYDADGKQRYDSLS